MWLRPGPRLAHYCCRLTSTSLPPVAVTPSPAYVNDTLTASERPPANSLFNPSAFSRPRSGGRSAGGRSVTTATVLNIPTPGSIPSPVYRWRFTSAFRSSPPIHRRLAVGTAHNTTVSSRGLAAGTITTLTMVSIRLANAVPSVPRSPLDPAPPRLGPAAPAPPAR